MAEQAENASTHTHVTMVCQWCSRPIKLSSTLKERDLAFLTNRQPETRKQSIPLMSETVELMRLSSTITSVTKSFKHISGMASVDHPLCQNCPDSVSEYYKEEIREAEEARRRYETLVIDLTENEPREREDESRMDEELVKLRDEEKALMAELSALQANLRTVTIETEEQLEREKKLDRDEKAYWRDFNEHQRKVLELRDESDGVELQLQHTGDQLSRLKRTSVLNTVFQIWHNGHFATINGLRFGKLPNVSVEWAEINAAWGQTALLLSTLANLCGCSFTRYTLVPYGSQSFIQDSQGKKKQLPLYTGARLFSDGRFDSAMVAFLDCLSQFKLHVESASTGRFILPYVIDKDSIGDGKEYFSIKMQFNSEEKWTRALKFVLTNLRWGMTWVSANLLNNDAGVTTATTDDGRL